MEPSCASLSLLPPYSTITSFGFVVDMSKGSVNQPPHEISNLQWMKFKGIGECKFELEWSWSYCTSWTIGSMKDRTERVVVCAVARCNLFDHRSWRCPGRSCGWWASERRKISHDNKFIDILLVDRASGSDNLASHTEKIHNRLDQKNASERILSKIL